MRVLKLSGHQVDDKTFLAAFATAVKTIATEEQVVIINGGGKSIKAMQEKLGLREEKIDGLRVTNDESLLVAEMVMSGYVNKLIVRALQKEGLNAIGISGSDGHLLRAKKKLSTKGDLGHVGEIIQVDTNILQRLMGAGFVPVVSPVSVAIEAPNQVYNVNGDEGATAVAQALGATQLDFISNVPGVLRNLQDTAVIPMLTPAEANQLTAEGIISDGMVPKVKAALEAIAQGVHQARIVDLNGLMSGGTLFTATAQ